jgi:hypothetical protein
MIRIVNHTCVELVVVALAASRQKEEIVFSAEPQLNFGWQVHLFAKPKPKRHFGRLPADWAMLISHVDLSDDPTGAEPTLIKMEYRSSVPESDSSETAGGGSMRYDHEFSATV